MVVSWSWKVLEVVCLAMFALKTELIEPFAGSTYFTYHGIPVVTSVKIRFILWTDIEKPVYPDLATAATSKARSGVKPKE